MDERAYRVIQESFYSNLNGTTPFEIGVLVTVPLVSVLLRNVLILWLFRSALYPSLWTNYIIDFVTLIAPFIMCCTVWSEHVQVILTIVLSIVIGLLVTGDSGGSRRSKELTYTLSECLNHRVKGKRPFVSYFRAYALIVTAIVILAVDFVIYPRKFAKTETYGTGFMDIGVGGFVISNAVVSPEARGNYKEIRGIRNAVLYLLKSIKSTSPLLILGFGRLISVKASDYHEHISEYGVHWNFFFTLAAVRVMSTLCLTFISHKLSLVISCVVAIGYQYCLTNLGLEDMVLHGSDGNNTRVGFLNANREGIFSTLGYMAIYFAGVQLGMFLFKNRSTIQDWCQAFLWLLLLDIILWLSLMISTENIQPVSRRMANLPFIIWTFAYSVQLFTGFLMVDIITMVSMEMGFIPSINCGDRGHKQSQSKDSEITAVSFVESKYCLIGAINRNQLLFFLLSNVMTGVINMNIQTILQPTQVGLVVIFCYMFILSFVHVLLHASNITTKVW
ncbi:glucosaminyl-phosphatidylinositol-acyltransferase PIGW-like [Glandiceps talaboti]